MRFQLVLIAMLVNQTWIYADACSGAIDCLRKKELSNIKLELAQFSSYDKLMINWQVEFLKEFDITVTSFDFFRNNEPFAVSLGSVYYYINKGDYFFHKYIDKNIEVLENYKKALEHARLLKDKRLECEALKKILWLHRIRYLYDNETYSSYLDGYKKAAYDDFERANYHYFNLILNFKNYYVDKWDNDSQDWLITYFKNNEAPFLKAVSHQVFASYYEEIGDYEMVKNSIRIAEEEFSKISSNYKKNRVNQLLLFAARIAAKDGEIDQLNSYLSEFDTTTNNKSNNRYKSLYFFYGSVLDTLNGDYRSAYNLYIKYVRSQDSLRRFKYNDLLNELETKYNTAEKEKQILEEQQKARENRNWLIASIFVLIIGACIAILVQQNASKKHQLVKQEVSLKEQKVKNLLKEQELIALNAMIEGQETERKRIAEDLHDRLGSTLSAAKMHMDVLADEEPRYEKISSIVDKAVNDTREIAHNMLSGVLTKFGLMAALQDLKETIEAANQFDVRIQSIQFDGRLSTESELHIYRILQELISNTLKHGQASMASITLEMIHQKKLAVRYLDDGIGFDLSNVSKGMGLKNIESRVDKIEGSYEINTAPSKGIEVIIKLKV